MNRFYAILLCITMIITLVACGGKTEEFELALITNFGTIDDGSFNQGAWDGLVKYADENGISYKYYQPIETEEDAYLNAIDYAIQNGAKLIVTPGILFEVPIYKAQERYPETKFLLLDGAPNNGDWNNFDETVGANVVSIFYAEDQSGFLAGYAAVKDGYHNLGFMGGMAVPPVIRFGLGFIQGAEYAAQELGLPDESINLNYFYTGSFDPMPEIQSKAAAWYNDGTEVIFVAGGGIIFSVIPAAEQVEKYIIGVDVDQSDLSDTIITSAMKLLTQSVYDTLTAFYKDEFPGGQKILYSASNMGVGLPMETSKFITFSQDDYDSIFERIASGSLRIDNSIDASMMIPTRAVVVNDQN